MDFKRHDKWSAVNHPSKHRTVVSSNPEFRGQRQGAKPFRFAAPPKGELGVLNNLSESQNLKLQADPRPCRRPLPKVIQNRSICRPLKMGGTNLENGLTVEGFAVHWDILWCHLNHIFEAVRYQSASMGGRVGFFYDWLHLGVVNVKISMVFTAWDTHCPLCKKVMFRTHFGFLFELIWEPWRTFVCPNVSLGAFLRSRRRGKSR